MQLGERERAHRALGFPRETVVNCIHGAQVTACGAAEADTGYYINVVPIVDNDAASLRL